MRTHRPRSFGALLLCGVAACTGPAGTNGTNGTDGAKGDQGPKGDPGVSAPTTGNITGVVTDGVSSAPLAGVAVTAVDLGGSPLATATTGSDGSFALTVTAGPAAITFAKDYYTSPGTVDTSVGLGETTKLAVTMSESATGKPSITLAATGNDFGFGASVPLTATATDPNGDTLTYTWSNATSPALGSVTGTGSSGTATMPTMQAAFARRDTSPTDPNGYISGYAIENRFGILPILNDTRGQMSASVKVDDGHGQTASASITLNAASVLGSVHNLPLAQHVYFNSGHDTGNAWSLGTVPTGSTAAFDDPTLRTPSIAFDKPGAYTIKEGTNSMTVYVGTWRGVITGGSGDSVVPDSNCTLCHGATFPQAPPDMFTPWMQTGHATMMARGINGKNTPYYSVACLPCHTVGYDDGVANGGFDDVAAQNGWTFPTPLAATNWGAMVSAKPAVAQLANIQCENCHGPQTSDAHMKTWDSNQTPQPFISPRIAYSAETCATCHAASTTHHLYSEWNSTDPDTGMGHSNRTDAQTLGASATGLSASCGRCHTAQGYSLYADLLATGKFAFNTIPAATLAQVTSANAEPQTCVACHDPHDKTNPNQLRFYGDTPLLPGGFAGYGMGKGALCMTCHNSRNGAQLLADGKTSSDSLTYLHEDGEPYNAGNPVSYSAPHQADQGDVFLGHNAYFMGANMPMTSKHAAIEDTCVGCHMTLQPKTFQQHGATAHGSHFFRIKDEDLGALCSNCHGNNVNGEGIQGQVEAQLSALGVYIGSAVKAKANAIAGGVINVRAWDPTLDMYTSTSAGSSNLPINVGSNAITSVGIEEIHGQSGFVLNLTTPITVTYVNSAGVAQTPQTVSAVHVQISALKDGQTTPVALYALSGNMVRACWNYFLVEGDQSKGLHNPSFVNAVLNNTLRKDLSN